MHFALASTLAACSPGIFAGPLSPEEAGVARFSATGAGKIKHVVYVVQENRTIDNLFQGYPGADTVSSGEDSKGGKIVLQSVSLATKYDLDHSAQAMFTDCRGSGGEPGRDCRMDGWDKERVYSPPRGVKYPMYVYVPHSESKPYFDMAHEWVLGDRMFASQIDESFVAHQYVIAAQAASSVNVPLGLWGCGGKSYDFVLRGTTSFDVYKVEVGAENVLKDLWTEWKKSH